MSLKFDELIVSPCLVETPVECETETPSVDPRCADPAFASANPEICGTAARLIIKPNIASICANSAVQFRAYLVAADGGEQLLEMGVIFTISNLAVGIIGALSGNVTGIAAGIATVTATWQGLTAFAQLTVVDGGDCCEDTTVGMVLLIDNSQSMQQVMAGFGNKLNFAKEAARQFAGDLNTVKDDIGVFRFAESGAMVIGLSDDVAAIQAAINSIPGSIQKTNLYDGLEEAINYLNSQTLDKRAIIVLSDGENKQGASPVALAQGFITAGGVIQVVGVRAHGDGFALLSQIASGGMFVNAYDLATGNEAIHFMRNMKGYYCAGNCVPEGDAVVSKGQLTFENFINWDVLGPVDLIGGTWPHQLFDLIPGNGLYVDTNGSGPSWLGHMRSKAPIVFTAGKQFEVKVRLAGNQRNSSGSYVTKFKIGTLLDEDIEPSSYTEGFVEYTFTFAGDGSSEKVEMISQGPAASPYGNLWDYIRVRNTTDAVTLLEDNFDADNPTYISPACGGAEVPEGYDGYGTWAYGYACYGYGCLNEPPPEQEPDPSPLPDIEES